MNTRSPYRIMKDAEKLRTNGICCLLSLGILYAGRRGWPNMIGCVTNKVFTAVNSTTVLVSDCKDAMRRSASYLRHRLVNGKEQFNFEDTFINDRVSDAFLKFKIIRTKNMPLFAEMHDMKFPPGTPTCIIRLENILGDVQLTKSLGWHLNLFPHAHDLISNLSRKYEVIILSSLPFPVAHGLVTSLELPIGSILHSSDLDAVTQKLETRRINRNLNKTLVIDTRPDLIQMDEIPNFLEVPDPRNNLKNLEKYLTTCVKFGTSVNSSIKGCTFDDYLSKQPSIIYQIGNRFKPAVQINESPRFQKR